MKLSERAEKSALYALTPTGIAPDILAERVTRALRGGIAWLQYRDKPAPDREFAERLLRLCRQYDTPLIVNDDPELARTVGADGVHLGRDDVSVARARSIVGPDAWIGVSCYDDLSRAERLACEGADYLAFGSMYASPSKPHAVSCPLVTLAQARGFGKPVVAIGGITLERAPEVLAAGADLVAVISDLFDAPDIEARARAYTGLFRPPRGPMSVRAGP